MSILIPWYGWRDFAYSYNEPMARNYFWHPAYDDYPVVGVDWHMANAFAYYLRCFGTTISKLVVMVLIRKTSVYQQNTNGNMQHVVAAKMLLTLGVALISAMPKAVC